MLTDYQCIFRELFIEAFGGGRSAVQVEVECLRW